MSSQQFYCLLSLCLELSCYVKKMTAIKTVINKGQSNNLSISRPEIPCLLFKISVLTQTERIPTCLWQNKAVLAVELFAFIQLFF